MYAASCTSSIVKENRTGNSTRVCAANHRWAREIEGDWCDDRIKPYRRRGKKIDVVVKARRGRGRGRRHVARGKAGIWRRSAKYVMVAAPDGRPSSWPYEGKPRQHLGVVGQRARGGALLFETDLAVVKAPCPKKRRGNAGGERAP